MEEKSYARECGLRCSRLRMAQGMSQQELAEKVFTTAQNISKYEKNGISNIDMIRKISDALGHNLLIDETDEEGIVGEIGKEILWQLISSGGVKAVDRLAEEDMYGMNMTRVNQEIFKLEHIGMCVREQYKGFDDALQDQLFITAKGIITYKNIIGRSVLNTAENNAISRTTSYERLLGGAESYQDFVDQRPAEKLIRQLNGLEELDYRVNYIRWLKDRFEEGFEPDKKKIDEELEGIVPGKGFYHDLIYRMAMHYDYFMYDALLSGDFMNPGEELELEALEEEFFGESGDTLIWQTERIFKEEFKDIIEDSLNIDQDSEEDTNEDFVEKQRRLHELQEKSDEADMHYLDSKSVFKRSYEEGHDSPYPTHWFSDEEIRDFIENNLYPASSDSALALDRTLAKINELEPATLQYYQMPESWENNGIAQKVRDLYGLSSL